RPRRSQAVTTPQPRPVRAVPDLSRPGGALRSEAGPYFGDFGGRFLPEALVPALDELTETYEKASIDPEFTAELQRLSAQYTGRPSPARPPASPGWPAARGSCSSART